MYSPAGFSRNDVLRDSQSLVSKVHLRRNGTIKNLPSPLALQTVSEFQKDMEIKRPEHEHEHGHLHIRTTESRNACTGISQNETNFVGCEILSE